MPVFIDYSDKRIGRVSVLSLVSKSTGGTKWNCKCDCGNIFICWSVNFKRGEKFECTKCICERRRGIDLVGRKFGRWTVLKREIDCRGKTVWACKCDCGNEGRIATSSLGKKSKSMSCGCLGRKLKSKHVNTTLYPPAHGLSKSYFYSTRTSLVHKCYNVKHPSYKKFGGIGITVCDLWRNGTRDMFQWAHENNWEKGDVFFLNQGEKEFNPQAVTILKEYEFRSYIGKKGGFQITYNGETHSISNWANILGVNCESLRRRILKYPSLDEVFGTVFKKQIFSENPGLKQKVIDLYNLGKTQTEIGNILNINPMTLRYQLIKAGIELRKEDPRKPRNENVKDEDILILLKEGFCMNQIADKLSCSFPCIKNRINKINGINRTR